MLLVGDFQKDKGSGHGTWGYDLFQEKAPALVLKKVFRFVFFWGNEGGSTDDDEARFFQKGFRFVPAGILQGSVPELADGNNVMLVLAKYQNPSDKGVLCKDGSSRFRLF